MSTVAMNSRRAPTEPVSLDSATLPGADRLRAPTFEQSRTPTPQAPTAGNAAQPPLDPHAPTSAVGNFVYNVACGAEARYVVPIAGGMVGAAVTSPGIVTTALGGAAGGALAGAAQEAACDNAVVVSNVAWNATFGAVGGGVWRWAGGAIVRLGTWGVGALGGAAAVGAGAQVADKEMGPEQPNENLFKQGIRRIADVSQSAYQLVRRMGTYGLSDLEDEAAARTPRTDTRGIQASVEQAFTAQQQAFSSASTDAERQRLVERMPSTTAVRTIVENAPVVVRDRANGYSVANGAEVDDVVKVVMDKIADGTTGPYVDPDTKQQRSVSLAPLREAALRKTKTPEDYAAVYLAIRGVYDAMGEGTRLPSDKPVEAIITIPEGNGPDSGKQIFKVTTDPRYGQSDRAYVATMKLRAALDPDAPTPR